MADDKTMKWNFHFLNFKANAAETLGGYGFSA